MQYLPWTMVCVRGEGGGGAGRAMLVKKRNEMICLYLLLNLMIWKDALAPYFALKKGERKCVEFDIYLSIYLTSLYVCRLSVSNKRQND